MKYEYHSISIVYRILRMNDYPKKHDYVIGRM